MEGFWAVGFVISGALSYTILPYLGWRAVCPEHRSPSCPAASSDVVVEQLRVGERCVLGTTRARDAKQFNALGI